MSSSIDLPLSNVGNYTMDAPMAFRRERHWFLSFVMTPFKDIDERTTDRSTSRQPRKNRGR